MLVYPELHNMLDRNSSWKGLRSLTVETDQRDTEYYLWVLYFYTFYPVTLLNTYYSTRYDCMWRIYLIVQQSWFFIGSRSTWQQWKHHLDVYSHFLSHAAVSEHELTGLIQGILATVWCSFKRKMKDVCIHTYKQSFYCENLNEKRKALYLHASMKVCAEAKQIYG